MGHEGGGYQLWARALGLRTCQGRCMPCTGSVVWWCGGVQRTPFRARGQNQVKRGKGGSSAWVASTQQKQRRSWLGLRPGAGTGARWGLWFHSFSLLVPARAWITDVSGLLLLGFLQLQTRLKASEPRFLSHRVGGAVLSPPSSSSPCVSCPDSVSLPILMPPRGRRWQAPALRVVDTIRVLGWRYSLLPSTQADPQVPHGLNFALDGGACSEPFLKDMC